MLAQLYFVAFQPVSRLGYIYVTSIPSLRKKVVPMITIPSHIVSRDAFPVG
jgi:hypothetical protein